MSTITYAGAKEGVTSFRTKIQLPAQGAWRICCDCDQQIPVGTAVEVLFRGVTF